MDVNVAQKTIQVKRVMNNEENPDKVQISIFCSCHNLLEIH